MTTTVEFEPSTITAIALVGNVVTWQDRQWTVRSVEGWDWYAFLEDDSIVVDQGLTSWAPPESTPIAVIVPSGHNSGDGFSREVPVNRLTRGVCLTKRYV